MLSRDVVLVNELGLHARAAAELANAVRELDARVELANATTGAGPVPATGVLGVLTLGVERGHTLRVAADGPDAQRALERVVAAAASGFGELGADDRGAGSHGAGGPGARATGGPGDG